MDICHNNTILFSRGQKILTWGRPEKEIFSHILIQKEPIDFFNQKLSGNKDVDKGLLAHIICSVH